MKKLLIGLLALSVNSALAGECTVGNLQLNFKDEATKNLALAVIKEKGYKIDPSETNALSLSLGFQHKEQQQWPKRLCTQRVWDAEDFGCRIHNSVRAVVEDVSYAVEMKRAEYIHISNSGEVLMDYNKPIGHLTSYQSKVNALLELIPNCEDLKP